VRAAVAARPAACGQVAGPVASTYWWNDEIERAEEWFVFFKLPADRYEALAGSAAFLAWIAEETRPREAPAVSSGGGPLRGGRDVPGQDDRYGVFRAEGCDGAGVEPEQPTVGGRKAEPARGEHPKHVAVRDQRHVAVGEEGG